MRVTFDRVVVLRLERPYLEPEEEWEIILDLAQRRAKNRCGPFLTRIWHDTTHAQLRRMGIRYWRDSEKFGRWRVECDPKILL
jgi:hypothetical protein